MRVTVKCSELIELEIVAKIVVNFNSRARGARKRYWTDERARRDDRMIDAAESNLPETDSDGDGGRSMDTQVSLHTTGFTQR